MKSQNVVNRVDHYTESMITQFYYTWHSTHNTFAAMWGSRWIGSYSRLSALLMHAVCLPLPPAWFMLQ